mgnify:CR=1 FL=1
MGDIVPVFIGLHLRRIGVTTGEFFIEKTRHLLMGYVGDPYAPPSDSEGSLVELFDRFDRGRETIGLDFVDGAVSFQSV